MLMSRLRGFVRDRNGSIAVLMAFTSLPAIVAIGAGVDYSRASNARIALQGAMDAAVLSAVSEPQASQKTVADQHFRLQVSKHPIVLDTVDFVPQADGTLRGFAKARVPTTLTSLVGKQHLDITVQATARMGGASSNVCILVLDPNAHQSFLVNSGANITAPNCEIHVRSNRNPAAIVNAGTSLAIKNLCVKGSILFNTSSRPPHEQSCNTTENPFVGNVLPKVTVGSCTHHGMPYNPVSHVREFAPGRWCGDHNFNGSQKIRFQPGLHVISGRLNINSGSEVIAEGVTFYFTDKDARFQLNGNTKLTFTAPKTGPFAGIAMDEKQGLQPSQMVFNGMNGQKLSGLFNLPSRNVTFNANANVNADDISMVVNQLILNSVNWKFDAASEPSKRIIRKNVGTAGGGTGGSDGKGTSGKSAGAVPYLMK